MSGVSESTSSDNGVNNQHMGEEHVQVIHYTNQDAGDTEPPSKRARNDEEISQDQSIKQILFNINKAICLRLDAIENKLEAVNNRTKYLEEKVETLSSQLRSNANVIVSSATATKSSSSTTPTRRNNAVIVGLPQERTVNITPTAQVTYKSSAEEENSSPGIVSSLDNPAVQNLGPNVTLITLNTEEDFPNGTWLGDETNPEMRVRVPVTPSDLLHIHSNCRAPEKMALTLLDYLFDKETQAVSNLSGMGKHGKKQLDPLMIYGVRCHLIHKFGIAEQDWHRIKQNIDSKCRTAFRRKLRGLPLTVKAFRGKAPPTYVHMGQGGAMGTMSYQEMGNQSDDSLNQAEDAELHIAQDGVDVTQQGNILTTTSEIIHSAGGEIQVLHATPEQVAQLQQTHQIQILQGDQVMQLHPGDGQEPIHVQVSMANSEGMHVMSTQHEPETITINPMEGQDSQEDDEEENEDVDEVEQ